MRALVTPAQWRLWFLAQAEPDALGEVVARHGPLRTGSRSTAPSRASASCGRTWTSGCR